MKSVLGEHLKNDSIGPVHLVPFFPSGFISDDASKRVMAELANAGAGAIEVGVPFSDPIADGPTIQAAYHETLSRGVTLDHALELGRPDGTSCPRLVMVSYSLAARQDIGAFLQKLVDLGYAGVLCPDLPVGEAEAFCAMARAVQIDPILLVAPNTPAARRNRIGELAGGFIYYLSIAGTTGERDDLPAELETGVRDMRDRTDLPICVGFGISRHRHLQALEGVADGAIVGSAFVRAAERARDRGDDAVVDECGRLARSLIGAPAAAADG
ncbi:MAG: tryptophan synthase subunit alpha [Planctomycetota bacterium]